MRVLCVLAASLVAFSCSCGPKTEPPNDGGPTDERYACEVDATALERNDPCQVDDHCPCGTHCTLGRCAYDCKTDGECPGQVCNAFGRCVDASRASSTAQALVTDSVGLISINRSSLSLDSAHPQATIELIGTASDSGEIRVETKAPLAVQCESSGAFGDSCSFEGLSNKGRRTLQVKMTQTAEPEGSFTVTLYTRAQTIAVGVKFQQLATPMQKPLEGQWQGFARPVAFGSIARVGASTPPAQVTELSIPVSMTVYAEVGNKRVVELRDNLGIVFPGQPTVGALLRGSGGDFQLRHVAQAFLGKGAGGPMDVDVAAIAESSSVVRGLSGLTVTLRTRYLGAIDEASAPYVDWQLTLAKVGELPASPTVPTEPAAYVPGDVATRASAAFASETSLQTALAVPLAALPVANASTKAQAVMCTPYGAVTPESLEQMVRAPWSGDLGCTTAMATPAQVLTFGLGKTSTWQLSQTLTSCIADLTAFQAVNAGMQSPAAGMGCVDGPRIALALTTASEADRNRALGQSVPVDANASSLAHRTLQQWLTLNTFVAKQATQVDVLNDVLGASEQIPKPFKQVDIVTLTGRGLDLLLHPRVAMAMSRMPAQVVYAPDYRPRVQPSGTYNVETRYDLGTGLPVSVLLSLQQTTEVFGALYERARYVQADRVPLEAAAKEFLRKSLVLYALSATLYDTTRANNPTAPPWDAQWSRAAGLYGIGVAGLMRSIDNLRAGGNPLDIDDRLDLPLYRVGDQVGSTKRFSAVSDYLLGTASSLDNSAIVPARIIAATTALDAARTAWAANLNRSFVNDLETAAVDRRLEGVRRRYGEQITSLCGDAALDSNTALQNAANIDPDSCFVRTDCRRTPAQQRAALSPGSVAFLLCSANEVRSRIGTGGLPTALETGFEPQKLTQLLAGTTTVRSWADAASDRTTIVFADGTSTSVSNALFTFRSSDVKLPALTPDDMEEIQDRCQAVANASEITRPNLPPNSCTVNADCPGGYTCNSSACAVNAGTQDQTACYTGALGELAAGMRESATQVEISKSQLAELSEQYGLQMKKCFIAELGAQAQINATIELNKTIDTLAAVKLAADVVSNAAGAVKDCASQVGADSKFGAASVVGCGAAAVEAAADSVSDGMEFAMEQAQRNHDLQMMQIQAMTEKQECFVEAEMALVGSKTAVLQIRQAQEQLARQLVEFENRKADLRDAMSEGQGALAAETSRTVPPLAIDYWLDEKVEAYGSAFRAARRAAYLGVLAVEYEYQLSTIEKQNVLAATRVAELSGVLDRLRNLVATGSISGRPPGEIHAVVSLRENLLQLADQKAFPPGMHTMTLTQRLQALLTSPAYAVYNADGSYAGQEVPFRIAPLAQLKLGKAGGIALLSGSDCAERVWSVNAAIIGDDVLGGSDSMRTRITLRKRNTFYSQWCVKPAGATDNQRAATRPSRNLFLDPFVDYVPGGASSSTPKGPSIDGAAEANAFASARLQPLLNVARADFEGDMYSSGASQELSGRGLYGDYALLFPAEVLAVNGAQGLKLDKVTDILLRWDYVSVAR